MKFLIECGDYSHEFNLPEGSTVIGSARGSRLLLEFPGVEPKHAQCYWDGSPRVVLKSLGAPLIVNGEQTDRTRLAAYDEIRIGEVKLTFLLSSAGPVSDTPDDEEGDTVPEPEESGESVEGGVSFEDAPDDSEVGKSLQKVSKEMIPAEEGRPTELIQRDGKWILRDLVTNREVEISPIEAQSHGAIVEDAPEEVVATPVKASPRSRLGRAKKSKLPLAIVPALLCLGVILFFSLRNKNGANDSQKTHQEFERQIRMGFAWLQKDRPAEAKDRFKSALNLIPESRLSRILLDLADIESSRGKGYENYRWAAAEQVYAELEKSPDASVDMREFARNRSKYVVTHRIHAGVIKEARQLFDQGDPIQAEEKIRKLPKDSLILRQYKEWVLKCRQEAFNALLASMTKSFEAQEWDAVVATGERAAEINPDSTRLSDMRKLAQKSKLAQTRLSTALELLDTGRRLKATPKDATSVLQQAALQLKTESGYVWEGTAYRKKGVEALQEIIQLIEQLSAEELVQSAIQLFATGEAQKALELLSGDKLSTTALGLKKRIAQSMQLEKKAKEYDTSKQYEAARDSWNDLLKLAGEGTASHLRAQSRLKWYEDNAGVIATEYWKFAMSVIEDHPQRSRALLGAALAWSASHKESKKALDGLNRKANLQYRLGYTKREQNAEEARKHFQSAAKFAEENSELAIKARRELRKLDD
jgi:hypothetical protein